MATSKIQVFESNEFGQLEVLMIDGKPYFPANECARVLGYAIPKDAIIAHCKGAVKHLHLTKGGKQKVKFIPEGDLYRLIIRSKLPAAEHFEVWVFDEVLPTIRKHGGYITDGTLDKITINPETAAEFLNALLDERTKREVLEDVVKSIAPKVLYHDIILQCEDVIPISIIAKDYGMTAAGFNALLNTAGIQYKMRGTWLLYSPYCNKGYTVSRTYHVNDKKSTIHTYRTQRGRKFIYDYLKCYGVLPQIERVRDCLR